MVRLGKALLKEAGTGLSKTLSEILVCPLSKQSLRFCEETHSLISDSIGVSFPIKDGVPCLVPKDGKILDHVDYQLKDDAGPSAGDDADAAMHKD
ncbi:Protein preY, mitochondrial [Melia azedarach]|uniref:Protein preY, mitochondrial n=1 Tax=Melia azedarach TaxID=155640 RepID=A0ACC1XRN4_MELAZ|nr:Protein preY, mitochondrial [Melia azedarach]